MRALNNITNKDAKKNGWKIIKADDTMEVVSKATYSDNYQTIMKTTKRFKVSGGWIYNTSTEYCKNNNVSIAEALVFVPNFNSDSCYKWSVSGGE